MNSLYEYKGKEIYLFANVDNWKRYFGQKLRKHIRGKVLEVGAGLGATTQALSHLPRRNWTCLEPDARLASKIFNLFNSYPPEARPNVISAKLVDLATKHIFDTILYVDVLEHIEDDAVELSRAANHLNPQRYLVVLSPAH